MKHNKTSDFDQIIRMTIDKTFVQSFELHDRKPRAFLALKQQIDDVKFYCCGKDKVVLGIDPTYDLGPFYLTPTVWRHPVFENITNGKNVMMPGPFMIHTKMDQNTFEYFGTNMSKELGNRKVHHFGSDGQKAMINGLKSTESFKESKHLICTIHHRKNCEEKLRSLGVKEFNRRRILRNIYGEQMENHRVEGLIDCESSERFDEMLEFYVPLWDMLERADTDKEPQFSTWYKRHKAQQCKENMLKPLRQSAGLGEHAKQYTNNDSESLNSVISRFTKGKKTWEEMAKALQDFVESKYKELAMAIHGSGERRVAERFSHLKVSKDKWIKMTPEERKNHIGKIHITDSVLEDDVEHGNRSLSVAFEESGIGGFASTELAGVWKNASNLLGQENSMSQFPGQADFYACFSGREVHTVHKNGKNSFTCDSGKCKTYIYFDKLFCHHTLAVAEKYGALADYICHINSRNSTRSVNVLIHEQCVGAGKKKSAPHNRKGPNNTISREITEVTALPLTPQSPDPGSPPTNPTPSTSGTQDENMPLITARPSKQPFSVCLKVGLIARCYGCNSKFSKKMDTIPNDIILRHLTHRCWRDKNGEMRQSVTLQPTYYHLNMSCARRGDGYLQTKDIIVFDEDRRNFSPEHITKLRQFGINI